MFYKAKSLARIGAACNNYIKFKEEIYCMSNSYILVEQSKEIKGEIALSGAKNAALVIIASLILTRGKSILRNVPCSDDIIQMIKLIKSLGARVTFFKDDNSLEIDTTEIDKCAVSASIMRKMRASILVMGPLLVRFGKADIALPGGCVIGDRPVDYHLKNFKKMNVVIDQDGQYLKAHTTGLMPQRIVLEYPSVGATENIMMAAVGAPGTTTIVNAALEPEVLDLIAILKKMGAQIEIFPPATIAITGVEQLQPVDHAICVDRLEAGSLLITAAITKGEIYLPQANAYAMDVFLMKLEEMGHHTTIESSGIGIYFKATNTPRAVSFKTAPYPGFPTDLQAPMMALQCVAEGASIIEETVFENRLLHVRELQKMGAQIKVDHNKATVIGVEELYGAQVIATDIRASVALVAAGLAARGTTKMTGLHHWLRGYDKLEQKLTSLGAKLSIWHESEIHARQTHKEAWLDAGLLLETPS